MDRQRFNERLNNIVFRSHSAVQLECGVNVMSHFWGLIVGYDVPTVTMMVKRCVRSGRTYDGTGRVS